MIQGHTAISQCTPARSGSANCSGTRDILPPRSRKEFAKLKRVSRIGIISRSWHSKYSYSGLGDLLLVSANFPCQKPGFAVPMDSDAGALDELVGNRLCVQ